MKNITDALKLRVLQAKAKIPHIVNYKGIYIQHFGEQTEEELQKISDVWNTRRVDDQIILNIEKIAEEYSKINL